MKLDIIGDIHGCFHEFYQLTNKLGYNWDSGVPVHSMNRRLAFVGDLTDRGPESLKVVEAVVKIIKSEHGYYVPGNHCNKLYRFFLGNKVQHKHGLETTVAEFNALSQANRKKISADFIHLYESSPLYHVLDEGRLVIAHAGIRQDYIGKQGKKIKTFVLYGDITGKTLENGRPERRDWALEYKGEPLIVYGHTPVKEARFVGNTVNIDTGSVFGNKLSALRYPEKEVVSVPSSLPFDESRFRE
ncbi:bis(5'-nucleosyl)-tetraphosphatase PrpE [Metabacillus arenae]|uniref:Bis(5'-nucleosyl)-tetraphosphatase PrpE n=1 Tax=Metabacillus arenae TaxID=2771434 RepID=A0A926NE87_9BACI|nr:bis(5'-nucleosyl)-tetraphosphatase PrpE [Metabacillus arenae]MBD1381884.1 bis(5'-nucleosyl)-tetraphosphatase PrpE [Metabacillus arenae]